MVGAIIIGLIWIWIIGMMLWTMVKKLPLMIVLFSALTWILVPVLLLSLFEQKGGYGLITFLGGLLAILAGLKTGLSCLVTYAFARGTKGRAKAGQDPAVGESDVDVDVSVDVDVGVDIG